ncbi:MAG: MoaD/ThiS family protein [Chloroflexi bacterium]|nr:MoaD/ThiS family protein [Chloroflexota bacterium]
MTRLGLDEGMVVAAAINNQNVPLETPLQPADKLAFFPPSAGG